MKGWLAKKAVRSASRVKSNTKSARSFRSNRVKFTGTGVGSSRPTLRPADFEPSLDHSNLGAIPGDVLFIEDRYGFG